MASKTNDILDLLKAKGIESTSPIPASIPKTKRRFYNTVLEPSEKQATVSVKENHSDQITVSVAPEAQTEINMVRGSDVAPGLIPTVDSNGDNFTYNSTTDQRLMDDRSTTVDQQLTYSRSTEDELEQVSGEVVKNQFNDSSASDGRPFVDNSSTVDQQSHDSRATVVKQSRKRRQKLDDNSTTVPPQVPLQVHRQLVDNKNRINYDFARVPIATRVRGEKFSTLVYLYGLARHQGNKEAFTASTRQIAASMDANYRTIQTMLARLKADNYIFDYPEERVPGPTGYGVYGFYDDVYQALQSKPSSSTVDQLLMKYFSTKNTPSSSTSSTTGSSTNPSSKLVSDLNTNLLTVEHGAATDDFASFSADWGGLESHIMKLERFGISAIQLGHLRQQKVKLYGYEIMELTDRFEALAADPKKSAGISSKAGFFVSECRKKAADPKRACFLDAIELPHERELRLQAQVLVQERQRLESAMAAISEQEDSEGFHVWCEKVGGWDAAFNLVPHGLSQKGSSVHRALVREYFRRLDQRVDASIEN